MASNEKGGPATAWSKTSNSDAIDASQLDGGQFEDGQTEDDSKSLHKPLSFGTIVDGRYEIISVIGRGGCGCVYKVRQIVMGKVLALKTLNPSTSRLTILRLQKEAQAMSRLEHPNIVHAFDFGMLGDDQPFFVMEHVNGPTLGQHLKQAGKLTVEAMIELFAPICQALSYAHEKGVVHRDIKPSNIILAEDDGSGRFVPKVVDFGIAKFQHGDDGAATLTKTGEIFGTPLYMSPEQCNGSKVDHRSDIYSLGCMMFQALTGSPPFSGSSPIKTMMEHTSADIPSLKETSPESEFPLAIEQIIANMLAKNPADRYQSFKQVHEALMDFRNNNNETLPVASQPGARRRKQVAMIAAFVVVTLVVVAATANTTLHKQFDKLFNQKQSVPKQQPEFEPLTATFSSITKAEKAMLVESPTYFSWTKGESLYFKFPKLLIGKLKFFTSEFEKQEVIARRTVSVPRDAKLTLFAGEPLLLEPTLWSKFRPTDLYGIRVDFGQAITAEKFDDAVDAVLQITREQHAKKGGVMEVWEQAKNEIEPNSLQDSNMKAQNLNAVIGFDNLHLLALLFADFNDRSWLHMGTMPNLRWLWLDACKLNGKKPRGENFIQLSNLTNLRVLSIDKLDAPQAMLAKLGQSQELKRLSLGVVAISRDDSSLIAKIPNLDTLRLRELALSSDAQLEQLAAAPHLERLALDEVSIKQTATLSQLVKLKHLKELVVDFPKNSKEFHAIKVVPGCKVQTSYRAHTDWFDWSKENPDVTGLW